MSILSSLRCAVAGLVFAAGSAFSVGQTVPQYQWSTLAGRATVGDENGAALAARFNQPTGIVRAADGTLFVADAGNHAIRAVSASGAVTTFAGATGQPGAVDGTGGAARFNRPRGLAIDAAGNLYVADTGNFTVRKITPAGVVTTLAGAAGVKGEVDDAAAAARFSRPTHVAVDLTGTNVFVLDEGVGVRRIFQGSVTTVFRESAPVTLNGVQRTATIRGALAVDGAGVPYVSARLWFGSSNELWVGKLEGGMVVPWRSAVELSGLPIGSFAEIDAMALDAGGNLLVAIHQYFQMNVMVARVGPGAPVNVGDIKTSAGGMDHPYGLASAPDGTVYFTRWSDDAVLRLGLDRNSTLVAGTPWSNRSIDGVGGAARFVGAVGFAVQGDGTVWVADEDLIYGPTDERGVAANLRRVAPTGEVTTPKPNTPKPGMAMDTTGVAVDAAGTVYYSVSGPSRGFVRITAAGGETSIPYPTDGPPVDFVATGADELFAISDQPAWSQHLFRWGGVSWLPIAGVAGPAERVDGALAVARFGTTAAIGKDRHGNLYVVDYLLQHGGGGYVDAKVRKITPGGIVSTVSGDVKIETTARAIPRDVTADDQGRVFLLYDDNTVRIVRTEGEPAVVGGLPGIGGSRDGRGGDARFFEARSIEIDAANNLYVLDSEGTTVRKGQLVVEPPPVVNPPPQPPPPAPEPGGGGGGGAPSWWMITGLGVLAGLRRCWVAWGVWRVGE